MVIRGCGHIEYVCTPRIWEKNHWRSFVAAVSCVVGSHSTKHRGFIEVKFRLLVKLLFQVYPEAALEDEQTVVMGAVKDYAHWWRDAYSRESVIQTPNQ